MVTTWVLVADSSRARIFSADTPAAQLAEVETLSHPEGRKHDKEMASDEPGKHSDNTGLGRHGFTPETEPKKQEAVDFAKRIAKRLETARSKNGFAQLIIVAAPSFLGVLRDQLNGNTSKLITWELNKNLAKHDVKDIRQHLPDYLPNLSL